MKTKITTLLMIFAFFVTSVALADGQPKSSEKNPSEVYLGPPIETPRHSLNSIEGRVAMFLSDFFSRDSGDGLYDNGKIHVPYDPTLKDLKSADPIRD